MNYFFDDEDLEVFKRNVPRLKFVGKRLVKHSKPNVDRIVYGVKRESNTLINRLRRNYK